MSEKKNYFDIVLIVLMMVIFTLIAFEWADSQGVNKWIAAGWMVIPLPVNYYLAVTRGKSTILMLVLTFIFGWIITLILSFFPVVKWQRKD